MIDIPKSISIDTKSGVVQIDGTEFPWPIASAGPSIRQDRCGLFEVTLTLFAENVTYAPT